MWRARPTFALRASVRLEEPSPIARLNLPRAEVDGAPAGLEPAASDLEGRCSIQLSYERVKVHRTFRNQTRNGSPFISGG
jgi:hypothetical protein